MRVAIIEDVDTKAIYLKNKICDVLKDDFTQVDVYPSLEEVDQLEEIMREVDVLLVDMQLRDDNIIAFAQKINQKYPHLDVIFITSHLEYVPKM